ncbi:MAG TPA: amidohydrolase family protein [Thermomicrobiales bacterium]|nr:amidohydrolase family protein [Thermomicrobiales bacterium]
MRTSVIDVDIHPTYNPDRVVEFLPEAWKPRFLAGNRGPGTLGYWNPGGVARADAVTDDGQRIGHDPHLLASHVLDEYNVEFCVLNPEAGIHIGVSPELDYSAALLSAINDHFIEDWLPVDSRYRLSITVAPNDPVGAAAEIRRVGNAPGVVQVVMGSGARTSYGNRFYYPIYEAAQEMGLPVAIHPGNEGVGITGPTGAAGFASNYFEWHSGLVTSYITHLISLVTEGVFIRFPELKFVMIEGGVSWLPSLMWRLDKNWKALRMTVPWLTEPPSAYIQRHVYLTTQPIEEPENSQFLAQTLGMFDAGNMLMFSSDYPHWDGDTPDFAARFIPKEQRDNVLRETARRLYRLPGGGE